MKTSIRKKLAVAALMATSLFASGLASAGLLQTTAQTQAFNFATLNTSSLLAFNGFNSALGTLNSVHLAWNISNTLNNTVTNTGGTPAVVGSLMGVGSIDLTATATTTFTGTGIASSLSGTNTLTTPGFTGTIPAAFIPGVVVGTASQAGTVGSTCLSNDLSCGAAAVLTAYIGGLNLFNINVSSFGSQGGSVPATIFTGNNGTAFGSVSLFYDYTGFAPPAVPAPGTMALLGLGLLGLAGMRRKAML